MDSILSSIVNRVLAVVILLSVNCEKSFYCQSFLLFSCSPPHPVMVPSAYGTLTIKRSWKFWRGFLNPTTFQRTKSVSGLLGTRRERLVLNCCMWIGGKFMRICVNDFLVSTFLDFCGHFWTVSRQDRGPLLHMLKEIWFDIKWIVWLQRHIDSVTSCQRVDSRPLSKLYGVLRCHLEAYDDKSNSEDMKCPEWMHGYKIDRKQNHQRLKAISWKFRQVIYKNVTSKGIGIKLVHHQPIEVWMYYVRVTVCILLVNCRGCSFFWGGACWA